MLDNIDSCPKCGTRLMTRRKRGICLFPAVFLWMLISASMLCSQAKSPSIQFDGFSKDMGRITQGGIGKQVFSFSNRGDRVLEIESVEPS